MGCDYTPIDMMWERAALRGANHVVFPSSLAAAAACTAHGEDIAARSSIIPLGIDEGVLQPTEGSSGRASSGAGGALHVVSVGAVAPHKGQDLLLRAFLRADIEGELNLVGPVRDKTFQDSLIQTAARPPKGKVIHFGGAMPHAVTLAELRSSDLFCLLSRFDVFPQAVIEAMASHVAPLIGNTVGCVDVIKHMESGYITETEDIDGTARIIEEINMDRASHAMRGERAHATAITLTWPKVAERYLELYEGLTNDAG